MTRMNRLLILIALCVLAFASCKKADDTQVVINGEQAAIDDKLITDYLTTHGITNAKRVENTNAAGLSLGPDTIGVWYQIVKQSTTPSLYNSSSTRVTVGYTGTLLTTGEVFAQTGDFHPSFTLGEVIKGWQVGIPKVNKNGIIRLFIASRNAYGAYAHPEVKYNGLPANGLPANAVLIFDIEVIDVTN